MPADEFHIVLYMIRLLQTRKTFPVIRMSYFAVNFFHSIIRHQNPCPTSLHYNILVGIKRILAYSATKKSPVSVSQLYGMCSYFWSMKIILSNLRIILICVLFFVGFLRFSKVVKLKRCDIIINKTILSIFI